MRILLILFLVLAPLSAHAAHGASARQEAELRKMEQLGEAMYRQDAAAAGATDILFSRHADLEARYAGAEPYPVVGWIVTGDAADPIVTFIGKRGDDYVGRFDIHPEAGKKTRFHAAEGRKLTAEELAAFMARQKTLPLVPQRCAKNSNSLVLRNPDGHGWLVYWLAASSDPNLIPLGGHNRFTVPENGDCVPSRDERFSLSACLTLDKRRQPPNAVGLFMTFSANDTPVETHVFLNLLYGIPLYVQTASGHWKVESGKITGIPVP